jgi:hypothetical protein
MLSERLCRDPAMRWVVGDPSLPAWLVSTGCQLRS